MKIIKKVVVTILTIILVLLMAFNIYNFYCIKVLKQDLASVNGYAILEVVSGSMEPTIHVGDLIVIDTKEVNYQKGDIVTFKDVDGSFVTHRIKHLNKDTMITRGDNNDSNDEEMPTSSLIGKYLFKMNGLGRLLAAFKSPFVMVMIFIIGLLACVFISTDKDGNPILDEDEKEFREFQEYQNHKKKKQQDNKPKERMKEIQSEEFNRKENSSYSKKTYRENHKKKNQSNHRNQNSNRNNYRNHNQKNHYHSNKHYNYKNNQQNQRNVSKNNSYENKKERDR